MYETPKRIPHGDAGCILCRKSLRVAKEKINVIGERAFDISSLVKRAANVDLSVYVECEKLAIDLCVSRMPCIKLMKLGKTSKVIFRVLSLFALKDCQKITAAH